MREKRKGSIGKKLLAAIAVSFIMTLTFCMSAMAAGVINPTQLNDYQSSKSKVKSYGLAINAGKTQVVQQIKMPYRGLLMIDLSSSGLSSQISFELFSNPGCTSKVGYNAYLSSNNLSSIFKANIPKAGTYYLRASRSNYGASVAGNFKIKPYSYSGYSKTIKNNAWAGTYGVNYNQIIYHKIVITKPGYIRFQAYGEGYQGSKNNLHVTLYSNKKKALSDPSYLYRTNNYSTYYGVKKGTYYIGIKTSGQYRMKYTFASINEKTGSSKSRAVSLRANSTVKGLMIAGESGSQSDWYKLKLTKKQKLSFTFSVKANDSLKVTIVPASSRLHIIGASAYQSAGTKTYKTRDSLPAGTYYLQVSKLGNYNTTSGHYTLKYK